MPTTTVPSQNPVILVLENTLPQLCGNMGFVTHSPPPGYFVPGLPTQSSSPSYVFIITSEHTLGSGFGKAPGIVPSAIPVSLLLSATAQCGCTGKLEMGAAGEQD